MCYEVVWLVFLEGSLHHDHVYSFWENGEAGRDGDGDISIESAYPLGRLESGTGISGPGQDTISKHKYTVTQFVQIDPTFPVLQNLCFNSSTSWWIRMPYGIISHWNHKKVHPINNRSFK